jgi:lysophospholipase L1-like esterase
MREARENIEWVDLWCQNAEDDTRERILLIGDSITRSYYPFVREHFAGRYNVDRLSTSYAINAPAFMLQVSAALVYDRYTLIHFNHGLHGKTPFALYAPCYEEAVKLLMKHWRLILFESTMRANQARTESDPEWAGIIAGRNQLVADLARKYRLAIDPLHEVTAARFQYLADNVHYNEAGCKLLSETVCASIESVL